MSEHLYQIDRSTIQPNVVEDIVGDFGGHAQSHPVNQGMEDDKLLGIMHEFTDSREFRIRYSERDRQLAIRAFVACEQGRTWKYGSRIDTEGALFAANAPAMVKVANLVDGLVLSGALGWHDDEYKNLIDYSKQEEIALPEAYRLVGAVSLTTNPALFERGAYMRETDGIKITQYVGADMQGDFRTRRVVSAGSPVIAPHGEQVSFSPIIEQQQAAAYHSSERDIVAAMLAQLLRDLSEDQKQATKEALLARLENEIDPSVVLFADFGDEARNINRYARPYRRDIQTGEVLKRLIVQAQSPLQLRIVSGETSLRLITERTDVPGATIDASRLEIPNDEIPDFIVALGSAGQGRVSVASLRELIAVF